MKKSTKTVKSAAPQAKKTASTQKAVGTKKAAPKKAAAPAKTTAAAKPVAAPVKKAAAPKAAPVKKAPVTKAPVKKVAVKKAAVKKVAVEVAAPVSMVVTAKIDVGFGNAFCVRGEGAGLSWDAGVALDCISDDEWSVSLAGATAPVTFKLLINDETWSTGDDYVVEAGSTLVLEPSF
ncbi:MAG: hypothetical protein J6386_13855 [Candidatus Synoicihabitans palmerolidicus]|nr:hypothetical protein [Candidatus Synoicihabitans palmerolidicus]